MPTPIGHALAGIAVAWAAPRLASPTRRSRLTWGLTAVYAALAALPDADLLYQPIHRTVTHSIPMAVFVTIIAGAVTGWVIRLRAGGLGKRGWDSGTTRAAVGVGLICGLAWGSHVLLDWLGADINAPRGIQALWPFSDRWYISGWDLFSRVERRELFSLTTAVINARAVAQEIAIIGPLVALLWYRRRAGTSGSGNG